MFTSDLDPAMRYEQLARFAFDCGKWEDPWGYAAQEVYNGNFIQPNVEKSKKILNTVLTVLIYKNQNSSVKDDLLKIEQKINDLNTQTDIVAIIENTIKLLDK